MWVLLCAYVSVCVLFASVPFHAVRACVCVCASCGVLAGVCARARVRIHASERAQEGRLKVAQGVFLGCARVCVQCLCVCCSIALCVMCVPECVRARLCVGLCVLGVMSHMRCRWSFCVCVLCVCVRCVADVRLCMYVGFLRV